MVGMEHRMEHKPSALSGGEQQRVAIVRALCQPFDFLLLDEPVSHLDRENNLIAGTVYDSGEHRAVVIGFPFETIKGLGGRQSLMKQVLDFFADPSPLRNKSK